jgi:hypothetical protein
VSKRGNKIEKETKKLVTLKRMTKQLFTVISVLFITSLFAQGGKIFSVKNGKIDFQSDAPFELIKATSKDLKGLLDVDKKTFAFKIRIETFEGFNSALQREHFNENYMESKQYPEASFTGKIIEDIDFSKNGLYTVRAKGKLLVHGIEQERIIKSDVTVKDGNVSLQSKFSVLLDDHNIPIPRVVKDKLASEIKLDITARLEPR